MKVFISYSTKDRKIAERLYADMDAAGAEVFQFGQTEKAGRSAWGQVLRWIGESDAFIVLLSQSSVTSEPVEVEIDHAHHRRANGHKPNLLIPAIIEAGVELPTLIERFAAIDLVVYETGLARLVRQLDLKKKTVSKFTSPFNLTTLPDMGDWLTDYKTANPDPAPASVWSRNAEKVLKSYKQLEPAGLSPSAQAFHIDQLLLGRPSKYDEFFNFRSSLPRIPLNAPKLKISENTVSWDAIPGATEYVLEESSDGMFTSVQEVYRGKATEFRPFPAGLKLISYYRVKAIGAFLMADSVWSNSEAFWWAFADFSPLPATITAPQLSIFLGVLNWTEVKGAHGYILESDPTRLFLSSTKVYEGDQTYFSVAAPRYYRVCAKAESGSANSPWSNTVKGEKFGRKP